MALNDSSSIKIKGRSIGAHLPVYIVAEVGINHNGCKKLAMDLIAMAARSGVDAVKFQLFSAQAMYPSSAGKLKTASGEVIEIYECMQKLELPEEWLDDIIRYSNSLGIAFICTVCDPTDVWKLAPYGPDAFKVASYEISHIPLLEELSRYDLPVIFSTGCSKISEVEEAIYALQRYGNPPVAVLQCVAKYPAPLEKANVNTVKTFINAFPRVVVGYSDHTADPIRAPVQAVVSGARIVEKHITLDRSMKGPDHCFALDEEGLRAMVTAIRSIEEKLANNESIPGDDLVMGIGERITTDVEMELRAFAYRSIFSTQRIRKGEPLTRDNIAVLRSGELDPGLHPRYYSILLENKACATKTIEPQCGITWSDILSTHQ